MKDNEEVKDSNVNISYNTSLTINRSEKLHNMKTIDFILLVGFHHKVGS